LDLRFGGAELAHFRAKGEGTDTMRRVSQSGLALIKNFEGFAAEPVALSDGRWLSGYGHVSQERPQPEEPAAAEARLLQALAPIEARLSTIVLAPLDQSQFDALASFALSIGVEAFERSEVLRRLNAGEPIAAADAMGAYCAGVLGGDGPQVFDALVRRRAAEKALFLALPKPIPTPSAVLQAQIQSPVDDEAQRLVAILADEPATRHALRPPPAAAFDIDEEEHPAPPVSRHRSEDGRLVLMLAAAGVAMLAIGLFARSQGAEALYLFLTAPGALLAGVGAWRLVRNAGGPRTA
jgi:GH24 family phage-related lysozyme (muramidase)